MPISDTFFDPILLTIMADPVVCEDGFTYDRPTIEQHFRTRTEEEERRQREEEEGQAPTDGAVCCGARREIQLTSPKTNEVISGLLLPNRNLEQQIVELVEAGHPDLSEDDIADWKERRQQKRENDRKRAEEAQQARERQEERRRNREAAEARRREEAAQNSGVRPSAPPPPQAPQPQSRPPAEEVRVDRRVTNGQEVLCRDDLGLSVALCEDGSRVSPGYVSNVAPGGVIRCMVACCAKRLDGNYRWCDRCGRMACSSCLEFKVTDFSNPHKLSPHSICGECVAQIVDVMDPSGSEGQARAFILNTRLRRYNNDLTSQAIEAQDRRAKLNAENQFGPGLHQLEDEVDRLKHTKEDLEAQARDARERAERARNNDGSAAAGFAASAGANLSEVAELEAECQELQRQYSELTSKEMPTDEEAQIMHFTTLSDIESRLEQKQIDLSQARSTVSSWEPQTFSNATADGDLQETCNRLERELAELVKKGAPDDEEGQMAHMMAISDVSSRLEEAQVQLAEASTAINGTSSSGSFCSVSRLIGRLESVAAETESRPATVTVTRHIPPPTSHRKKKWFGRKSRTQEVPPVNLPPPATTVVQRNPIPANVIDGLRDAHMNMMKAENGNDPTVQLESLSEMLVALRTADTHVNALGGEDRRLLEAAKEEVGQKHMAAQLAVISVHDPRPQSQNMANQTSPSINDKSNLTELQQEFVRLNAVDTSTMSDSDAIMDHMMRLSELQHILQQAEATAFEDDVEIHYPGIDEDDFVVVNADGSASTETDDPHLLDTIGFRDEDWPLPLGLKYPTTRMENQLELLKNALAQQLAGSERKYDDEYGERRQRLTEKRDRLEDEIQQARAEAQNAEASAEAEQQRLREREERRRREEEERRERERVRAEKERQAREEENRLRRKHEEDERVTREAFASAVGGEDNAARFGGRGDFRMCGRCKAGPIENFACSDLAAHNDTSTSYKGNTVASTERPNSCKHCDWFDPDWHNWPLWDGVWGPH